MKEITKAEFLAGYEEGYISDIVAIGNKVYGKDPRGKSEDPERFEVVYCQI